MGLRRRPDRAPRADLGRRRGRHRARGTGSPTSPTPRRRLAARELARSSGGSAARRRASTRSTCPTRPSARCGCAEPIGAGARARQHPAGVGACGRTPASTSCAGAAAGERCCVVPGEVLWVDVVVPRRRPAVGRRRRPGLPLARRACGRAALAELGVRGARCTRARWCAGRGRRSCASPASGPARSRSASARSSASPSAAPGPAPGSSARPPPLGSGGAGGGAGRPSPARPTSSRDRWPRSTCPSPTCRPPCSPSSPSSDSGRAPPMRASPRRTALHASPAGVCHQRGPAGLPRSRRRRRGMSCRCVRRGARWGRTSPGVAAVEGGGDRFGAMWGEVVDSGGSWGIRWGHVGRRGEAAQAPPISVDPTEAGRTTDST